MTARRFWRSDACKEGNDHPGIAGICTSPDSPRVWVRRLTGDELLLPVPVTEFAGFFGNCCMYARALHAHDGRRSACAGAGHAGCWQAPDAGHQGSKSRTKIRSLAAIIAPKYSASAELKETDFCIFENQWNRHP